ncbi:hypothetical protein [Mycobacterium sp. OTB74]|jgi:hypothetical protein|uniref:hypothetical protein n=1 Tax=Mycobacterium sp. OTB74 TaxID=1853452 RepID=UPI002476F139|nr:hypothetical protein [Mycobacterium sp. OTB74]MDH6242530.1 hypothetical protein [Mycobacterium sp. OTB74]
MTAVDGVELLITALEALGRDIETERSTNATMPSYVVRRIGGGNDLLTDHGSYSVHTFALTDDECQSAASDADDVITALAPRYGVGQPVAISTGKVWVDRVEVTEAPIDTTYTSDRSIIRYTGTYTLHIRNR